MFPIFETSATALCGTTGNKTNNVRTNNQVYNETLNQPQISTQP